MNPNNELENIDGLQDLSDEGDIDKSASVDDFIKELEAKEKDLNITAETTFIEIAEGFDDDDLPDFLVQEFSPRVSQPIEPAVAISVSGNPVADNKSLQNEIAELRGRLSKMELERSEMFESSQRRARDFETLKARTERERTETFSTQIMNLAIKMLPALDNLGRALDFASAMPEDKQTEFKQFFEGIVLVNQQVNDVLSGMGIRPIVSVGRIFDPHLHEAVAIEESPDFPPNTISAEMLRGYRIGDKIIRHSMVKVSKQAPKEVQPIFADTYGEIEPSVENTLSGSIDRADNTFLSDDNKPNSDQRTPDVE